MITIDQWMPQTLKYVSVETDSQMCVYRFEFPSLGDVFRLCALECDDHSSDGYIELSGDQIPLDLCRAMCDPVQSEHTLIQPIPFEWLYKDPLCTIVEGSPHFTGKASLRVCIGRPQTNVRLSIETMWLSNRPNSSNYCIPFKHIHCLPVQVDPETLIVSASFGDFPALSTEMYIQTESKSLHQVRVNGKDLMWSRFNQCQRPMWYRCVLRDVSWDDTDAYIAMDQTFNRQLNIQVEFAPDESPKQVQLYMVTADCHDYWKGCHTTIQDQISLGLLKHQ